MYRLNKRNVSRENTDHCRECKCMDITQPDFLNEVANHWFDVHFFSILKPFVQEEFQRNLEVIEREGSFLCGTDQFGSAVMLYGPGHNTFSQQIGNTLIMQLEGSSCIKIAGGATKTVLPQEIVLFVSQKD